MENNINQNEINIEESSKIAQPEQKSEEDTNQKEKTKFSAPIFFVCAGLLLGLLLKLFAFEVLTVSGRSMIPALHDGDKIFVNKLKYGIAEPYGEKLLVQWAKPKNGDIVIYLYDDKIVVKRCVAISGDKLEYSSDSDYTLKTNGKEIPLTQSQFENLKNADKVPEGYILAVGDNYAESVDSRTYGFVSIKNVLGKVICK